jgi:hypothetical protein
MCQLLVGSRPGLLIRARDHHAPFWRGHVVRIWQRRVAGRHLVIALCAVPMPLTEDHERGLHFNDQPGELKGRVMVVSVQISEKPLVARNSPEPLQVLQILMYSGAVSEPGPRYGSLLGLALLVYLHSPGTATAPSRGSLYWSTCGPTL